MLKYTRQDINFLLQFDIKAIVIACNTADTAAGAQMQREYDLPICGAIRPTAKKAAMVTKNNRIGVIGTNATIRGRAYDGIIREVNPRAQVRSVACPLLVPLVENFRTRPGDLVVEQVVREYLQPLKDWGCDTLVLGCTHYPLLRSTLRQIMGEKVNLVNPAYETAVELKTLLRDMDLTRSSEDLERFSEENSRRAAAGDPILDQYQFFVSDRAENFTRFAKAILPKEVKDTKQINIEEY